MIIVDYIINLIKNKIVKFVQKIIISFTMENLNNIIFTKENIKLDYA